MVETDMRIWCILSRVYLSRFLKCDRGRATCMSFITPFLSCRVLLVWRERNAPALRLELNIEKSCIRGQLRDQQERSLFARPQQERQRRRLGSERERLLTSGDRHRFCTDLDGRVTVRLKLDRDEER